MTTKTPETCPPVEPTPLAMALVALLSASVVGVASAALQQIGWGALVFQSLLVGALLGIIMVGCVTVARLEAPRRWTVLLACLVAIAIQHGCLYRADQLARKEAVQEQVQIELFRPDWLHESPLAYFRSKATPMILLLWVLDGCLLTLAAMVIVEVSRRPVVSS